MILAYKMSLVQNSLTHLPTPQTHTHPPNAPIPTSSDLHTDLINTPTEPPTHETITTICPHPHTHIHPPYTPLTHPHTHAHTQNGYPENKRFVLFFSKTHSVQFILSMYLNRHQSALREFLKTNRFSGYPFSFIIRLYHFLILFIYKQSFPSVW